MPPLCGPLAVTVLPSANWPDMLLSEPLDTELDGDLFNMPNSIVPSATNHTVILVAIQCAKRICTSLNNELHSKILLCDNTQMEESKKKNDLVFFQKYSQSKQQAHTCTWFWNISVGQEKTRRTEMGLWWLTHSHTQAHTHMHTHTYIYTLTQTHTSLWLKEEVRCTISVWICNWWIMLCMYDVKKCKWVSECTLLWMDACYLNKRPTMMCLAKRKEKKEWLRLTNSSTQFISRH